MAIWTCLDAVVTLVTRVGSSPENRAVPATGEGRKRIEERSAVVDLHGTKTDIHFNKRHGIGASSRGKVNIHLPSQHNTTHDNVHEDRIQNKKQRWFVVPCSIANINAEEEGDGDGY